MDALWGLPLSEVRCGTFLLIDLFIHLVIIVPDLIYMVRAIFRKKGGD